MNQRHTADKPEFKAVPAAETLSAIPYLLADLLYTLSENQNEASSHETKKALQEYLSELVSPSEFSAGEDGATEMQEYVSRLIKIQTLLQKIRNTMTAPETTLLLTALEMKISFELAEQAQDDSETSHRLFDAARAHYLVFMEACEKFLEEHHNSKQDPNATETEYFIETLICRYPYIRTPLELYGNIRRWDSFLDSLS